VLDEVVSMFCDVFVGEFSGIIVIYLADVVGHQFVGVVGENHKVSTILIGKYKDLFNTLCTLIFTFCVSK